jgi:hypothetical protein
LKGPPDAVCRHFLASDSLLGSLQLREEVSQQRVDRIAAYDKAGSPGCALGVIRNGNFVYRKVLAKWSTNDDIVGAVGLMSSVEPFVRAVGRIPGLN